MTSAFSRLAFPAYLGRTFLGALAVLGLVTSLLAVPAAEAQTLPGAVGIRVSASNVDEVTNSADLDMTMYTRGLGPSGLAGRPSYYAALPALDFGDGSTIPTLTLALSSTIPALGTEVAGGVGGPTTVYRTLASLSHSYPAAADYTATAGMACVFCVQSSYVFFPPGSPPPPTFTATGNFLPATLVGNLVAPVTSSATAYISALGTSVRFAATYFLGVSNTTQVPLGTVVLEVPTASEWGLGALGALLLLAGLALVRRSA